MEMSEQLPIGKNIDFEKRGGMQIDDEQSETLEEHFELLRQYSPLVDKEYRQVSFTDLPGWFDADLFEKGQNYAKREWATLSIAYLYGAACSLMVPIVSKIFRATKRSGTPCLAFRRYFSSTVLFYDFHVHTFKDPDSNFYKAINRIKQRHSITNKHLSRDYEYGITLKDMALIQFTFISFILVKPEAISLKLTDEEKRCMNHFWRVIGYLLGVPNCINVCRENADETKLLGQTIMDGMFKCYAESLTSDSEIMLHFLFEGFNDVLPIFHQDAILKLIYEAIGSRYARRMKLSAAINYSIWKMIFFVTGIPVVGDIVRYMAGVAVRLYYYFYRRYPIIAWMKYGKIKSRLSLYSR